MENKKYTPMKILHIVLLIAALVFYIIAAVPSVLKDLNIFALIGMTIIALAMIASICYLFLGATKNAAFVYRAFFDMLVVEATLKLIYLFGTKAELSTVFAAVYVIAAMATAILAFGKDLKKTGSGILGAVLVICRVIPLILHIADNAALSIIAEDVAYILLAVTAVLMITEKYIDKAQRGRK